MNNLWFFNEKNLYLKKIFSFWIHFSICRNKELIILCWTSISISYGEVIFSWILSLIYRVCPGVLITLQVCLDKKKGKSREILLWRQRWTKEIFEEKWLWGQADNQRSLKKFGNDQNYNKILNTKHNFILLSQVTRISLFLEKQIIHLLV